MHPDFSTRETELAYRKENAYARVMFADAGQNYVSARCLLLNGLLDSAVVLYCSSLEKAFKAYIFLSSGHMSKLKKMEKHNPYLLKEELKKYKDFGFDQYDEFIKNVSGFWYWRYHDKPEFNSKRSSIKQSELKQWDLFWWFLFENVPFPPFIKYSLTFPSFALSKIDIPLFKYFKVWLLENNEIFMSKLPKMMEEFERLKIE